MNSGKATEESAAGRSLIQAILSLGPALITASVVLGPGSILLNSKLGAEFGTQFVWLLAVAVLLMMATTALAARLGVALEKSVCEELADRFSRYLSIFVGFILFVVTASFQSSNNLGLLFGIRPFFEGAELGTEWEIALLVAVNAVVIFALLYFRELYRFVERMMKWMVGLMLLAFAVNLAYARPSLVGLMQGFVPSLPENLSGDQVLAITGVVATTFSIGAAFYQPYLIRQKGWRKDELRLGIFDTLIGISVLGLMSLMIMLTSASVLYGSGIQIKDAGDLALQLRPLFGPFAMALLCGGILAGALSSFMVNAMLGGSVMSDAMGKGADINGRWTRALTIAVLLFGMFTALAVKGLGVDTASLIIFAQAVTVLGNPVLAASLLALAHTADVRRQGIIPGWLLGIGWIGFGVITLLSFRTAWVIVGKLAG